MCHHYLQAPVQNLRHSNVTNVEQSSSGGVNVSVRTPLDELNGIFLFKKKHVAQWTFCAMAFGAKNAVLH